MIPQVQTNLRRNEALDAFRGYVESKNENGGFPPGLNFDELEKGHLVYGNLKGYRNVGIEIYEDKQIKSSALELKRSLRIGTTLSAIIINITSALGLFYSGIKLLSSSFGTSNKEEAYAHTKKSFMFGSLAGLSNAISHENMNWGFGVIGMGLFSNFLDKPYGLAGFSMSDGLNQQGMGEVKRRDDGNAFEVKNSIFKNYPQLSFLAPYERSIRSCAGRGLSIQGWKRTVTEAPHETFQTSAGASYIGGGLLGVGSILSPFMSEKIRSLSYIPYSLTSIFNVIALLRDGLVTKDRATIMDGRVPMETKMMHWEGWAKTIAAPFLAVNYGILGLRGMGVFGEAGERVAMAFRAWGVAIANIGFAAQSAVKFAIPDLFGPRVKRVIYAIIRPKIIAQMYKKLIPMVNNHRDTVCDPNHTSNLFEPIIENSGLAKLLNRISDTELMQAGKKKSMACIPNELSMDRAFSTRFPHFRRVCALAIKNYDHLHQNTKQREVERYKEQEVKLRELSKSGRFEELQKFFEIETEQGGYLNKPESFGKLKSIIENTLELRQIIEGNDQVITLREFLDYKKNRTAVAIGSLAHDVGHAWRSHLAEAAHPIIKNNEESVRALNEGTEIYNEVLNYYIEEYTANGKSKKEAENITKLILERARLIIGLKHELSPLYKAADLGEYCCSKGGDLNTTYGYPGWNEEDYDFLADQRYLSINNQGKIQVEYTPIGAEISFKMHYARLLQYAGINYHPQAILQEYAWLLGAQNSNMTVDDYKNLPDETAVDKKIFEGINKIDSPSTFKYRVDMGGRYAKAGYGAPKNNIFVGGQNFVRFLETEIKLADPGLYAVLKPMAIALTTPTQLEIRGQIIPSTIDEEPEERILLANLTERTDRDLQRRLLTIAG